MIKLGDSIRNDRWARIWRVESETFKEIVAKSSTNSEILAAIGLTNHGNNFIALRERIEYENIDVLHILKQREKLKQSNLDKFRREIPLEEILVENSTYTNTTKLKERLIKQKLLEEKCYECGLGSNWNGKPLKLQLEHRNGIKNDHRLDNICLLCPNCHSQTSTFAGKNANASYKRNTKKCKKCDKKISKESKTGFCRICVDKTSYKYKKRVKKSGELSQKIQCKNCSKKITNRSKSGYCVSCSAKNRDNYRETKVQERPSRLKLIELILTKPFLQIGRNYGVSDNAVRRWCVAEGLPRTKVEINEQKEQLLKELEENKVLS